VRTGSGSVFVTRDHGDNWVDISYGMTALTVLSLHAHGDFLYAGVNAGGVWQYSMAEPIGACCTPEGACWQGTETFCESALGGVFVGDGELCEPDPCVASCCPTFGLGNVDQSSDGLVTMSDLTTLIDHLFISLTPLACPAAGNVDLSADSLVTMSDLTVMIDNLFITLTPLPVCP
jgi:hypothetical protein